MLIKKKKLLNNKKINQSLQNGIIEKFSSLSRLNYLNNRSEI